MGAPPGRRRGRGPADHLRAHPRPLCHDLHRAGGRWGRGSPWPPRPTWSAGSGWGRSASPSTPACGPTSTCTRTRTRCCSPNRCPARTAEPAFALLHRPMWDLSWANPAEGELPPPGLPDPRPGIWVSFVPAKEVLADPVRADQRPRPPAGRPARAALGGGQGGRRHPAAAGRGRLAGAAPRGRRPAGAGAGRAPAGGPLHRRGDAARPRGRDPGPGPLDRAAAGAGAARRARGCRPQRGLPDRDRPPWRAGGRRLLRHGRRPHRRLPPHHGATPRR